jgi:hypothetical protein
MSHRMPSLPPLSQQDLLLLSAYIDGELSDAERASLGERLQTDAALQAHLDELRRTVELVGQAVRLPVPRNFTLDPAVHGSRRGPIWAGAFGPVMAAGVAMLVVAACLSVLLLGRGVGGMAPAAAPAPAGELAEEEAAPAAVEEAPAEEAIPQPPAEEEEPAVEAEASDETQAIEGEFGGGEAAAPEAEAFEAPPPAEEEAVEETEVPAPTGGIGGASALTTTGSPSPGVERAAEATMLASISPQLTASLIPTPTASSSKVAEASPTPPAPTPTFTPAPTPTPEPAQPLAPPRLTLIAAGIVVLAGALAAVGFILLRRIIAR